jgi:hypothetical protein
MADICAAAVDFPYRSINRPVLNAYTPTLQMSGAMVRILREICGKSIPSGLVFKA